jgi:hypothetical protein
MRQHALEIANDTLYGLGAGVWTRNGNIATEWVEEYKQVLFGQIVTMLIQLTHHLVVTNNLVLEEKLIK